MTLLHYLIISITYTYDIDSHDTCLIVIRRSRRLQQRAQVSWCSVAASERTSVIVSTDTWQQLRASPPRNKPEYHAESNMWILVPRASSSLQYSISYASVKTILYIYCISFFCTVTIFLLSCLAAVIRKVEICYLNS